MFQCSPRIFGVSLQLREYIKVVLRTAVDSSHDFFVVGCNTRDDFLIVNDYNRG